MAEGEGLSPERCGKELIEGPRRAVYLFFGEEADRKESLIGALREKLADRFHVQALASEDRLGEVIEEARVAPMFDEGSVFIVRDGDKRSADDLERLAGFAARPSGFSTFLLLAGKPDRRRKAWKQLLERGVSVAFEPLSGDALVRWVAGAAVEAGVSIEPAAVRFLVAQSGGRMDEARERLSLLSLYLDPGETATERHCADLFASVREESIWELVDALVAGKGRQALAVVAGLLDAGESPHQLLGFLYGRFRLACLVQYHRARRGKIDDLAKSLGSSPFALKKLVPWTQGWTESRRHAARGLFSRADRQMKSSGGTPEQVLEHLVCQLANA